MLWPRFLSLLTFLSLVFTLHATLAHADGEASESEFSRIRADVSERIKKDLAEHFNERVSAVAHSTAASNALNPETRAVLLKGAYLALAASSPFHLSEAAFDKKMGKVLEWLADHDVAPAGITIGVLARQTIGEIYTGGVNFGAEMNFYLQDGKLMMTNYSLLGGQAGVGTSVSDVEFYAALCFGSCYGGNRAGWYMGIDGDISAVMGEGMFAEVGVDTSSIDQSLKTDHELTASELYSDSTLYIGFGTEIGIGGDAALGLYHYSQIGEDQVLANPGESIRSGLIAKQAINLKP